MSLRRLLAVLAVEGFPRTRGDEPTGRGFKKLCD